MQFDLHWRVVSLVATFTFFSACSKSPQPDISALARPAPVYQCPMHPAFTSQRPGDCPICQMRLIGVPASSKLSENKPSNPVPDQAIVQMPATREQLIGVKVMPVERKELEYTIRASAVVGFDPTRNTGVVEPGHDMNASSLDSTVSVYVDFYDADARDVTPGETVELKGPALRGHSLRGTIRSIDAALNSETRTLRARVAASDPRHILRPEMYLTAMIHTQLGEALVIPESALIDTGERQLVFVQTGPGRYEPREVKVGRQADNFFQVVSGLQEGEKVVISANFLIDSESKLDAMAKN